MKKVILKGLIILAMIMVLPLKLVLAQDFMPVSEIQMGMRGIGKTVLTGEDIEDFYVEVLGVMPKGGIAGDDLILVKVYGDVIERAGGVAQGMSGSPVYINGRLAGAIAYGWAMSDGRTAMLTPIESMLKMFNTMDEQEAVVQQRQIDQEQKNKEFTDRLGKDLETTKLEAQEKLDMEDKTSDNKKDVANKEKSKKEPAKKKKNKTKKKSEPKQDQPTKSRTEEDIKLKDQPEMEINDKVKQELIVKLRQYKTPLMVSGFTQRGLEILKDRLKEFDISTYETGSAQFVNSQPLQPGSAVSVDLVKGDLNIGALGTVTYVDEQSGRILAFGHPFFKLGNIDYFMSSAWMLAPVKSLNSSFKVGVGGSTIGSIRQDRASGIAGVLGKPPKTISLVVRVNDWDKKREQAFNMKLIVNEQLTRALLESSVVNLTDKVIDRVGEGTAVVNYDISATNLPEKRSISRKNMYYSPTNITSALTGELMSAMSLLGDNRFQSVDITNIVVDVHITSECKVVRIESAKLLEEDRKYAPGDTVDIEVTLQPYRSTTIKRIVEYKLPSNLEAGNLALMVRGGASIAWIQALIQQYQQKDTNLLQREMSKGKNFARYIDEFNNQDCNQDIVVDIMPGYAEKRNAQEAGNSEEINKNGMNPLLMPQSSILSGSKDKKTIPTEFLVTGDTTLIINVAKTDKHEE